MKPRYKLPPTAAAKLGFRSKLEVIVNQQLVDAGIKFSYEGKHNLIRYEVPVTHHRYLADFLLENGIIIEAKGRFEADDRKKHLYIKEQWPQLDIRFLFQNCHNRLRKGSKTTYASWCDKYGFKYCEKKVPEAWINEEKDPSDLQEIISILKSFHTEKK